VAGSLAALPLTPAISCIIPVFNGMRDIDRAVDSVLAQRSDAQVVLVDDCSTDGSRDHILERAQGDPRIVALAMTQNRGQAYARNIGVAAAEARFVTFLDQDDEHLPGWYDVAIEALESLPHYVGIRGELQLAGAGTLPLIDRSDSRWPSIVNSPIWNVVMHKAVYQAIGGSPTGQVFRTREGNEDWVVTQTIKRHFAIGKSEFTAVRHTVRPGNAGDYFLSRTRVTDGGFEFLEQTKVEADGSLARALAQYQARADANVALMRPPQLSPRRGTLRALAAKLLDRFLGRPPVLR